MNNGGMDDSNLPDTAPEPSKRVYRSMGLLSGACVFFAVVGVYSYIATDGFYIFYIATDGSYVLDTDALRVTLLGTAIAMTLPTLLVVLAMSKAAKVMRAERPNPHSIKFVPFLKSANVVTAPLSIVVGVAMSFALVTLGGTGSGTRIFLFAIGLVLALLFSLAALTLLFFAIRAWVAWKFRMPRRFQ